jgi:hypothetical protein
LGIKKGKKKRQQIMEEKNKNKNKIRKMSKHAGYRT